MEEKEQICFQIISEAGMARSCFFESIQQMRKSKQKRPYLRLKVARVIITKRILLIGNWYSKKHKVIKFGCRCY